MDSITGDETVAVEEGTFRALEPFPKCRNCQAPSEIVRAESQSDP